MNLSTKLLIGGLLGGIMAFLCGWVIYGQFMYDFFQNSMIQVPGMLKNTMNPGIKEWVSLMISQFSLGFLMAFVLGKFREMDAVKGLIAGAIIMLLISLYMNCSLFFQLNLFGKKMIIADALVSLVYGGLIGLVTGWYMGRAAVPKTP